MFIISILQSLKPIFNNNNYSIADCETVVGTVLSKNFHMNKIKTKTSKKDMDILGFVKFSVFSILYSYNKVF